VGQLAGNRLMGTSADRDGRYTREAEKRLTRVLALHPYHPGALKTLARIRALQGRSAEALELLKRWMKVTGEEGAPEEELLSLLEEAGRYKEAAGLCLDSPALGAEKLKAGAERLIEKGRADGAAIYLDHYLRARPLDGDGLALFAQCLKELPGEGEGYKDAYRRMHIAYALDWIEAGDFHQAERSVRASRRYGEVTGDAALLTAVIEEGKGEEFIPPGDGSVTPAVMRRLADLAAVGRLPEGAAGYVRDAMH
jgi:predicted Zn-dependent protease